MKKKKKGFSMQLFSRITSHTAKKPSFCGFVFESFQFSPPPFELLAAEEKKKQRGRTEEEEEREREREREEERREREREKEKRHS